MRFRILTTAALATLAMAASQSASAAIDFSVKSITEPLTLAQIQTAAGQTSTTAIDGVALGPGQDIFVMHRNAAADETFVRINPFTAAASFTKTHTSIATDLGTTWSALPNFPIPVGEFVWDPNAGIQGTLYFADSTAASPDGEYGLIKINVATGTASTVLFGDEIAGWNSHGVLPSGKIVGTLGEDFELFTGNEPQFGLVNPAAPSFDPLFEVDDLKAAVVPPLAPLDECPPETIGVHPTTGQIYVFGHDTLHLFRVDTPETSPTLNWLNIPGWTGVVDLHNLAVDADGNLYGFDEANAEIVVFNGTNTFAVTIADIEAAIGKTFSPALWRGLKVRKVASNQSEVWISDASGNAGVVRILFGNANASVGADWAIYE
jgi:hypothetical protein